ncbi:S-adenosylmethionine-dependent methyltransferase protein [Rutstroemia sp. NJR-2017a WRK4]|nr:S-adenosylmethionine-dependent methyltransferase protein [Rutstroemia sp. NJR-2017a WRK4]
MPFPFKHSNRSKQALNEAAIERAAVTPSASQQSFSSGSGEGRSTTQHQTSSTTTATSHTYEQPYDPRNPDVASRAAAYQSSGGSPPPSLKTRYQHTYSQEASPASPSPAGSSADDLVLDTQRLVNQGRRHTSHSPAVEHKKRSIFDRMRGTNSHRSSELKSHPPVATQGSYNNNSGGLARRLSRRHDGPPIIRTSQQRDSGEQHQRADWQPAAQGSRSHLPSPQEGPEDNGLDPYLITDPEEETPQSAQSPIQLRVPRQNLNTIRTVQSDSESPLYSAESQNTSPDQQYQQSSNQGYYHRSPDSAKQYQSPDSVLSYQTQDSAQQYQYQLSEQTHSQQQLNSLPSSPTSQYHDQDYTPDSATQQEDTLPHYRNEQRPGSVQSNNQSPTSIHHANRSEYPERSTSIQGPIQGLPNTRPLSQHIHMAPSSTQQNRRSADSRQIIQAMAQSEGRDPPAYRQQQQLNSSQPSQPSGLSPLPPASQGQNYRGGPPQRDQYNPSGGGEQGRSTPPPAPGDRDVNEAYKELLQKYKKVKGLYFDKTASVESLQGQVEQLQNTLANQRLSQSRTSLDDNEYISRFQRLDGAITNLAFNIRKDWRTVPSWLSQSVNRNAMEVGKQEMTAVGRACITKFLVDEIFNKTFHPGLDSELSACLKNIEQNIRRFSPALSNQEESDALTAKVVQWRLTTLDGLRDTLDSTESEGHKKEFSQMTTSNLTATLINFLGEPVPGGIEEFSTTIVELAVSIAANIPLESRDISVTYPMPNDFVQTTVMKVEAGIPTLDHPGAETNGLDSSSIGSVDKDESPKEEQKAHAKLTKEKSSKGPGMLQAMMGGGGGGPPGKKMSVSSQGGQEGAGEKSKNEDGAQKVRFAGFMGVEVRGRQVLLKSPIWTLG